MSTAQEIASKAMDSFKDKNRDLLACLKQTSEEVFERTAAGASLDPEARQDILMFVQDIDQEHAYARKVARDDLHKSVYGAMARAFVKCLTNGALTQAMLLTNEADDQLMELKYLAGTEQRPAPKPIVPVLSYDDQIRLDWETLPTDKINQKRRESAQYRKRLAELLDGDTIKSQISVLHDGGNL
jgi:hypothetical protein